MERGSVVARFASGRSRPRITWTVLAVLAAAATGAQDLSAQWRDPSSETLIYATFGAGAGNLGLAGHAGLSVRVGFGEFSLRTAGMRSADLLRSGGPNAHDLALLYGVRLTDGEGWFSAGVGPAKAWTTSLQCADASGGDMLCSTRVVTGRVVRPGVAFQAMRGWRGISLGFLGDVNAARSFVAATFNVHLGKVR